MHSKLSRRSVLCLMTAAAVIRPDSAALADQAPVLRELIGLATDPATIALDPDDAFRRFAFLGAPSNRDRGERWSVVYRLNVIAYRLQDGPVTRGSLRFSRVTDGKWELDRALLIFRTGDDIPLDPLQRALTRRFGRPQDVTMTSRSNTMLRWRGVDRIIEISADVPAIVPKHVYGLIIKHCDL